jgi:hypothetical protein
MIKPDLTHVSTLEQFYREIVDIQQEHHGQEYTAHHCVLHRLASQSQTIKELGVCQGATLATMLLSAPKKLIGIDIDDQYFSIYQPLFDAWAKNNNVDFKFIKGSSIDSKLVSEVDMLHIDSYHTYEHLSKELLIHAPSVKHYIVFHDTVHTRDAAGLLKAVVHYITEVDPQWQIIEHCTQGAGHTVIKRVSYAPV